MRGGLFDIVSFDDNTLAASCADGDDGARLDGVVGTPRKRVALPTLRCAWLFDWAV
jgi:hypothetical protein